MDNLTGFQRDLLYIVAGLDRPHGLAIKNEIQEYYEKEIQHGRLYPNLDELATKEYIEKGEKDKRTNYYIITTEGRNELRNRREWEEQYISINGS